MSDASAPNHSAETATGSGTLRTLEGMLFQIRGVPPHLIGLLVFLIFAGSFFFAAALAGYVPVRLDQGDLVVSTTTRIALVLSGVTAMALLANELARRGSVKDLPAFTLAFKEGEQASRAFVFDQNNRRWPLRLFGLAGASLGIALSFATSGVTNLSAVLPYVTNPIGVYVTVTMAIAFALFSRGIAGAAMDDRRLRIAARNALAPDPLDPERMEVFGRLALRSAFAWLSVALVISVMVVLQPDAPLGPITLVAALLGAVYTFVSTLLPVHAASRRVRMAALQDVRIRLRKARDLAFTGDVDAASALPALLAYEARLERARDWPLSAPVTGRFVAYALVPVLAWFGSAGAQLIVARAAG